MGHDSPEGIFLGQKLLLDFAAWFDLTSNADNMITVYYMASSVSGQDESNPALWLATRAGRMGLSCPFGSTRRVQQEKFPRRPYNKSFIDQACSVKMARYWPRSFFARLWTSTPSRSINTQKTNLANIQPSWPHTWSITHTYQLPSKFQNTFWFFQTCWWLTGLSRLYDASQPPGRHTRYFKTILKILVDRALMRHISILFDEFRLTLDRFTCCAHVTITDVNNLFPDFRSIYAVRFDFDFIHYKQSACLLFNK